MTAHAPVAAPLPQRPVVNLLAAANTPTGEMLDGEKVRWQHGGIAYESLSCGAVLLSNPCDGTAPVFVRGDLGSAETGEETGRLVLAPPVYAEAFYSCSALGWRETYRDRALATLDAEIPRAVEHELWTGAIASLEGSGDRYLTGPEVTDLTPAGGAVPASLALGMLEQALGDHYSGAGIIHTPRLALPFLDSWNTLNRTGRIIESLVGNRVVPGVGYPGTGKPLASPVVTATPSAVGGTLAAGTYSYEVTAQTATGETLPSAEAQATTTGVTGSVGLSWPAVTGAATYRVFGRVDGSLGLLGTTAGLVFTDTGAGAPGAAPPTSDTSGNPPAGESWVMITPQVTVRLGDPELPSEELIAASFVERRVNRIEVRPRALFTVDWDGCSAAFAIRVRLTHE